MVTRDTAWPAGTPCWIDLAVDDISRASAFYTGMFGWYVQPAPPEAPRQQTQHLDVSNPQAPVVVVGPPPGFSEPQEREDSPVPPEDIPDTRRQRPPPDDWNFIGRIFGQGN